MNENAPTNNQEQGVDNSFVDLAEGKLGQSSPMDELRAAKEGGDPVAIAEAEAAADEKYIVDPELHNAHVEAKKENDEVKSREAMEKALADIEARRRQVEQEVKSTFLSKKDALGTVQALVDMYRSNVVKNDVGAAGWSLYGEAVNKSSEAIPEQFRPVILELAQTGNGLLNALARGYITSEQAAHAGEKGPALEDARRRDLDEAAKLLSKIGVDPYNIRD